MPIRGRAKRRGPARARRLRRRAVGLAFAATLLSGPNVGRAATHVYPVSGSLPASIRERLAPGDTLLVPPGSRHATETLIAGLTIRGDGPRDSIVFAPYIPSAPIFSIEAGSVKTRIENITFDMHMHQEAKALDFAPGEIDVRGNRFIGAHGVVADSCTGVIAENQFEEPMTALRCSRSELWVDRNEIVGAKNGAIAMRGSPLRITRNRIIRNVNTGLVITGKRFVPVIGGEPGMGNELYGGFNSDVYTTSGQPINAQYNYWGIKTTEEMNQIGYPGNVAAILDGWDQEKAAGKVDYQNWLDAPGGRPVRGTSAAAAPRALWPVAGGGGLAIAVILLVRRMRRRAAKA
jgi:hypothetical protein